GPSPARFSTYAARRPFPPPCSASALRRQDRTVLDGPLSRMESFQEVIHVQTVFAVPTQLPALWSWTWVAVVLGMFLASAAVSTLWLWIEHRHARRHPKAG